MVEEKRKYCARFNHEDENCCYAKVVKEKGEYPVINFRADLKDGQPDLTTIRNVRVHTETIAYCVYCTHPNYAEEKFVGTVEPYFDCHVPNNCPEIHKKFETSTIKSKTTIWEKIKRFFKK